MAFQDHGGYGMVVEVSEQTIAAALGGNVFIPLPEMPFRTAGLTGRIMVTPILTQFTLRAPDIARFRVRISTVLTFSTIELQNHTVPVPDQMNMNVLTMAGETVLEAKIVIAPLSNLTLMADFSDQPGAGLPRIAPIPGVDIIDGFSLLQSFPVQFAFGQAMNDNDHLDVASLVAQVRSEVESVFLSQVHRAVLAVLIPAPIAVSVPVSAMDFRIGDRTLSLLYTICGLAGTQAAFTPPALLRRSGNNEPLDKSAVVVSNEALLRCIFRPAIAGIFGLTPSGFAAGHPFFWTGAVATPLILSRLFPSLPGATTLITRMIAATDENSGVRLLTTIVSTNLGGGIVITATTSTSFTVTASIARPASVGLVLTFTASPTTTVADISLAWWVYLLGGLIGPLIADLAGGQLFNAPISATMDLLLSPVAAALPRPAGVQTPATVRAVSLNEPNAPARGPLLGGVLTIPFPDQSRIHDLKINFV